MTEKATDSGDPGVERDVRNSWVVYIHLGTIDTVPFIEGLHVHVEREMSTCLTSNVTNKFIKPGNLFKQAWF